MYLWVLSFLPLLICGGNDFHSQTKQYLTQFRAHTNTHTSQWSSHWNFERPYNHINRTCFHTGSHSHKTTPHKSIHFCHPLFFPQSVPIPNNNACFSCHRCCCCFSFLALLVFLSSSRVAHVHRSKRKNASREMMMSVALISREMFLTHSSYSRAHTYKRTTTPRAWPVHQRSHLKRRNGNLLQRTKEKELRLFCICICIIPRISAAPIRTWAYFLCVIWLIASRLKIITLFSGNVCSGQQKIRRSDAASHRHRIPVYSTAFPSHSWVTR